MKTVLILVLSADFHPYGEMIHTSMKTWDSITIPGIETIFYCGQESKPDTSKIIYLPIPEGLFNIGKKTLAAFEWALTNKSFDYIARVHSSIYVNKKELSDYINTLPDSVFAGVEATSQNGFQYLWGGVGFILSKDVVEMIINHKHLWNHSYMEDEAMSKLASDLGISFFPGNKVCSIDKTNTGWQCTSYCERSILFTDFRDLKPLKHFFYRVKQDNKRDLDKFIMNELFKNL